MKLNKKQLQQHKQKPIKMTASELEKLKQEATQKALDVIIGFSMLALRDEFGFGEKRLHKFHEAFFKINAAYNDGYLSLEDVFETLEKETGIKFIDGKEAD